MSPQPQFASVSRRPVVILLAALVFSGCARENREQSTERKEETAIPVEVSTVERGDVTAVYTGTASLETDADALVVAKVGGEVTEILVEEGDRVTSGQVLARLDGDRLRLEMERTRANVRKLEQEYNRNMQLFERGLVSSGAFEDLKFELEALHAAYRLAQLEYDYTQIRAPIDGVVSQRHIRLGNTITANAAAFQVTALDPLIAYLHIPERELRRLEPGQPAELALDAVPGRRFRAHVKRISPVVDATTGTFKVTMEVPDPEGRLKPGMFGRFNVVWDSRRDVMLVPRVAVVDDDISDSLFVVINGKVERRPVTIGYASGDRVEVVKGLSGQEEIVVVGQSGLRDGSRVEIVRRDSARFAGEIR